MQTPFDLLATEALKLTSGEREAFVQLLVARLSAEDDVENALAAEVERRVADLESGVTRVVPMNEALALVRAGLK